jgi:hypothetical protein
MDQEQERQAHIQRLRDRRDAYVKLFGPPGEPTPYGKIVLDDLERFTTLWAESIHMTQDGSIDPYATIYRDGKKAVALRIHQWIRWSETNDHSSGSSPLPADLGSPSD